MIDLEEKAYTTISKYSTPKHIFAFFELISSVTMVLGLQLIVISFDFSQLLEPKFWVNVACQTLAMILMFRAVVNGVHDKTAQRKVVVDVKNEYKKLNDKKGLDLKDYLSKFNRDNKKFLYIQKISSKINKYENKAMRAISRKKIVKLNEKIDKLKAIITKEYVEDHIDRIKIKQNLVFYSDFTEIEDLTSAEINTRSNYQVEFTKATFSKIGWYMIISIILGVGIFSSVNNGIINLIANIAVCLIMSIIRISTALQQADKIYDKTITKSINDKILILKMYYEFKKENPTEFEKAVEEKAKDIFQKGISSGKIEIKEM